MHLGVKVGSMGLLLLMVAIYTSMSPVEGLSTEETTTLATLFQCFPQLGALPEDPATRSTFRYGTRWTNATVCESDGWAFYGIYCEGGAIVGVRIDRFWGQWNSAYDIVADFPSLKNLTITDLHPLSDSDALQTVALHLMNNANALTHLYLDALFQSTDLSALSIRFTSSLKSVTITRQDDSIVWNHDRLEHVNVFASSLSAFSNSYGTIKSLSITASQDDAKFNALDQFTALEELTVTLNGRTPSADLAIQLPQSLTSLTLINVQLPDNVLSMSSPSSLKYLRVAQSAFIYEDLWPSSIETLILEGFSWLQSGTMDSSDPVLPNSLVSLYVRAPTDWSDHVLNTLGSCHNLTNAYFDYGMDNTLLNMPTLTETKLRNLTIRSHDLRDSDWNNLLCGSILGSPTARTPVTEKFDYLNIANEASTEMIECIRYTNVTTLILSSNSINISTTIDSPATRPPRLWDYVPMSVKNLELIVNKRLGSVNWLALLQKFNLPEEGYHGLETLRIRLGSISGSFPAADFTRLAPFIREIDLGGNSMVGTLPSDFFTSLPQLQIFNISGNSLYGTIPHTGWSHLEKFIADGNDFTAWPSIYGPVNNLKVVQLSNNDLLDIPDDYTFGNMTSLTELVLNGNRRLAGPLPNVFGLNSIVEVFEGSGCAFDGPFPQIVIENPVLTTLSISNNRICDNLFLLPSSGGTMISTLKVSNNKFNGSYPSSWTTLQAKHIDVSTNLLHGGIADPAFVYGYDSVSSIYNFSYNPFEGSLFPVGRIRKVQLLSMQGTSVDFCTDNGGISVSMCDLPNSICDCQDFAGCDNLPTLCSVLPAFDRRTIRRQNVPPPPVLSMDLPTDNFNCTASVVRQPARGEESVATPQPLAPAFRGCPSPAPSGNNWICINGTWTSNGTVTTPVFVVPPTTIVVTGDLNVTGSVILSAGSSVIVQGCVYLGNGSRPVVTLELTKEDLERILKEGGERYLTLLQTTGNNSCPGSTDLSSVEVTSKSPKSNCRKTKLSNTSTKTSLSVLMSVDRGNCDLAIIIPSVVGGVLVLTAAALGVWLVIKKQKASKAKRSLVA